MSWTLLNSYTFGACSNNGEIIYAYSPNACYYSTNTGVSFTELLYGGMPIGNIKTISTTQDGLFAIMGGTGTNGYYVDLGDILNNVTLVLDAGTPIYGNWICSSACLVNSVIYMIISEDFNNPVSGTTTQTYTLTESGWGLAGEGYAITDICYFLSQSVVPVYYSYVSADNYYISYFPANDISSENPYLFFFNASCFKIACSEDNSQIYVLGRDNTNMVSAYYCIDGENFNVLTSIQASLTWSDISCSSNGQYVSLTDSNGFIWISIDFGSSFSQYSTSGNWSRTGINYDGAIIYASTDTGLYQSTNGGISCFEENTNILTNVGYVQIKNLKINDTIYTTEGYKKIIKIGYNFANSKYFKKMENITEFCNLILSGGHAVLFDETNFNLYKKDILHPEFYKHCPKINGLQQLLVDDCVLFTDIEKSYTVKYYHFVLENDNNIEKQYGVYANGILCECMSEKFYENSNLI